MLSGTFRADASIPSAAASEPSVSMPIDGAGFSENSVAKLEIESARLFRYRKYDVKLVVKKSWRMRSNISEIDVLRSLLSAKCCRVGSNIPVQCPKCSATNVVALSSTSNSQEFKVDRGEYEVYSCIVTPVCTSSRDHLHSFLVLVIDSYPFTVPVTSPPFILLSRDKTKKSNNLAKAAADPSLNATVGSNFNYAMVPPLYYLGSFKAGNAFSGSNSNNDASQSLAACNSGSFFGDAGNEPPQKQSRLDSAPSLPIPAPSDAGTLPCSNVIRNENKLAPGEFLIYSNGAEPSCCNSVASTSSNVYSGQGIACDGVSPAPLPDAGGNPEKGDDDYDYTYMMPEAFVSYTMQMYQPLEYPMYDPELIGEGEGAPDPSDCF